MNRNVMIVLAGGFLIAVLVALLVQAGLSGGKKEAAPVVVKEEPKVSIAIVSQDIKAGTVLTEETMEWKEWPEKGVFPGTIVQKEKEKVDAAVKGKVRRAFKEGEPLISDAIIDDAGNYLAAVLEPGMRAVAITVKPEEMVAGFVGPGDYVDIILTYKTKISYEGADDDPEFDNYVENTIDNQATETILENVKVLATDQSALKSEEEKVKVAKTVTLEVDRKGAEVIALSSKLGTLTLALRRLGDDKIYGSTYPVVTDARLTNIYDEVLQEMAKRQNKTSQKTNIVRIYREDAVEEFTVAP